MASSRRNRKKGSSVSIGFSLLTLLVGFILGVYLSPQVVAFVPQEVLLRFGVKKAERAPQKKTVRERTAKEARQIKVERGKYSLQVAVFRDVEGAVGLLDTLNTKGYFPRMETDSDSDGILYEVRLGSWTSKKEATDFAKAFERKEEMKATVVRIE